MKKRPFQIHSDFEAPFFYFLVINDSSKKEMSKVKTLSQRRPKKPKYKVAIREKEVQYESK